MRSPGILKAEISATMADLSPQNLQTLADFVDFLRTKNVKGSQPDRKILTLGGSGRETEPLTEQEITEARQEIWGDFGDRGL